MKLFKALFSLLSLLLLFSCAKDNYVLYYDSSPENKIKVCALTEKFSDYENSSFFVFKETNEYIKDFKLYENKVSEVNEFVLSPWKKKGTYSKSSIFKLSKKITIFCFLKMKNWK